MNGECHAQGSGDDHRALRCAAYRCPPAHRPIAQALHQVGPDQTETEVERSEEHTSELQSLMRISYAVFCLNKKKNTNTTQKNPSTNTYNQNTKNSISITHKQK